jgi:hypothetical protein
MAAHTSCRPPRWRPHDAAAHRRRVVHFNVTEHPTAHWTAQQIVDAFPDDCAPSYLLRDRDSIYGPAFRQRVKGMGTHSPWQNPLAERLIGSIRRECLNHVLVLSENPCAASSFATSRTITGLARIARSTRMRPTSGLLNSPTRAGSWSFTKSVASIIATSVWRPSPSPPRLTFERGCRCHPPSSLHCDPARATSGDAVPLPSTSLRSSVCRRIARSRRSRIEI